MISPTVGRPYFAALRSSRRGQSILLVLLAGYAAVSVGMGCRNALRGATGGQDLAPVYKASRLWVHGEDPYKVSSDEQWKVLTRSRTAPPIIVPVANATPYAPIALLNVGVAGVFEWQRARIIWLIINLVLAALIPQLIRRLWYPDWTRLELALFGTFWLSGLGLRVGLGLGQHQVVVLAAFLLGLLSLRSRRTVASGFFFALTLHKFTWPGVFVPMLLARRRYRVVGSMILVTGLLLAVFFVQIRSPMVEIVHSYVSEVREWFENSEALGVPGNGPFHFFPVLLALVSDRRLARVLMYGLIVAGGAIQVLLARRHSEGPEKLTVAGFVLLALWSTYHGVYDGVFLVLPLCVLQNCASTSVPGTLRSLCDVAMVAMVAMWLLDPLKIGLLIYHVPVEQVPVDGVAFRIASLAYRMIPFSAFWLLVAIQWTSKAGERQVSWPSDRIVTAARSARR